MSTKIYRLYKIEQYILEHRTVTMEELSAKFGLSLNTLRFYICELEKHGRVKKVYGGACSAQDKCITTFEERCHKCIRRKKDIGYLASRIVEPGDTIFIDSGTTAMYVIDYLEENKNITVLTHNLGAVVRATKKTGVNVICLPGELNRAMNTCVSEETKEYLYKYSIDKAFLGCAGITACGEATIFLPMEEVIKHTVLEKCNQNYLLMDSAKYGQAGLLGYANIDDFDGVIVDSDVEDIFLNLCKQRNVPFYIAQRYNPT